MFLSKSILLIIVSLVIVACHGNQVVLLRNLSQNDANLVILSLGKNDINADQDINKDGSINIEVFKSDQIKALSILNNLGEPTTQFQTLGQIFKKDGMISSPLEEQARFIDALNQEISAMLSKLDGVISVSAQVSLPQANDDLWHGDDGHPSASVLIKYLPSSHLDIYSNRIKELVANSVPGLKAENVQVMLQSVKEDN